MDLTYIFLMCIVLSSFEFSDSIAERRLRSSQLQYLKPVKTRRQNVSPNNCFCFQEKPTSLKIQEVLDNEGTKNLARLVVFLYKDLNTKEIYVYTPGASKQNQIPNPPYDHDDNLSQSVNQRVVDIFNVNPNVIPMPKNAGQKIAPARTLLHTHQAYTQNRMYPEYSQQYQNHYEPSNLNVGLLPGANVTPRSPVGTGNPVVVPNANKHGFSAQLIQSPYREQPILQVSNQPAMLYHPPQQHYTQQISSEHQSKSLPAYQAQVPQLLPPEYSPASSSPPLLQPQPHFQPNTPLHSPPIAHVEPLVNSQSSQSQSNEYYRVSGSADQSESSESTNSDYSIHPEPILPIPQVQAYPKLNQNQEIPDIPHLHPYTGLHLADKGINVNQGSQAQEISSRDGDIINAISNLPTYGHGKNDTGIYYTFDKWLHEQLNKVYKEQMIQSNTINLALLMKHIERSLVQNGMTLKNGVVLDQQGNALDMTNLKLRPILIGETVGYNNLMKQKVGEDQIALPSNLPYLESMLVSLVDPPKALGIIPLGKVFLPRVTQQSNAASEGLGIESTNIPTSASLQEIASHLQQITGSPEVDTSDLQKTEPPAAPVAVKMDMKQKYQVDPNQPQVEADTATATPTPNRRKMTQKFKPKVFTLKNPDSSENSKSSRRRLLPPLGGDELLSLVVPNPLNTASSLVNTRRYPYNPRMYGISSFVPEFRIIGGNAATSSGMPINIKGRKTGFIT